eukprot:comp10384_c0_seq1/m.5162 comp10384_c0_seq1/g.5162  ORF comp10384_c0_seq1/g.5162 comp10384_c0_seq1/m.5162 type:complete len:449 (-) comp10384_c0_seq1:695-2041(-)
MCKQTGKGTFTWQQLAEHNVPGDMFLAIRGKVYDVTEFSKRHPGGFDVLQVAAGRDATQVFETYHPFETKKNLEKFEIGTLISDELPTFPEPSPFFFTVKKRVEDYFKETNQNPKNNPWLWLRYACIFGTIFSSFAIAISIDNIFLQLALMVPMGWACALIGLHPMHDSSHMSITGNPIVWRILGASHDFINGASYLVWLYQHMLGHHPYTNIDGADPDIVTAEKDVRRIKKSQPWYSFYVNQHIYVPILYAALGLKTRLQDITILYLVKKNGEIRVNPITTDHALIFWGGKLTFLLYRFFLPYYLGVPVWKILAMFAVSDAVTSYWLALTFQANHVVEGVEWPMPDEKGRINMDWAAHQVVTTQDYAHNSWFWNFFSGALNHQCTHHLFPWAHQYYYPQISPIVAKTAKEFGVPYFYKETYAEAIGSHIGHLYTLGNEFRGDAKKAN